MKAILILQLFILSLFADDFFYQNNKKVYLNKSILKSNQNIYYEKNTNQKLILSNGIYLKTNQDINIILKKYDLTLIKKYTRNTYFLDTSEIKDVISLSNTLHEDKNIIYAHPNFIKKHSFR